MVIVKISASRNKKIIVLPEEFVKEHKFRAGSEVELLIVKTGNIKSLFGRGKHLKRKMSTQKIKDMLRKEWWHRLFHFNKT